MFAMKTVKKRNQNLLKYVYTEKDILEKIRYVSYWTFGWIRMSGELIRILPAESVIMNTPPSPKLFGSLHQKSGISLSWKWTRIEIYCWKTSGFWHTNWTELSTGKVNQDWSSASLIVTLECDRLYSIQLWHQQLYRYNIILCQIKKLSNQLYNLYVASPVLSKQRKWQTQLLFSSLCWSSWREVTSSDVCIQSSRYRSHT
jgi:hypothetical protein